MIVQEVLLCCCASVPHKGYSVQVQNSISYHLTGCSWILFPTQQGSNTVPDLYFVGIRSVLPVPALPSAPARDGWPSAPGSQGRAEHANKPGSMGHSPARAPSLRIQAEWVWRQEQGSEKNGVHPRFSEEVRQVCGDDAGLR